MQHLILYPMAFYVFYIGFLGLLTLRTRVQSVRSGQVPFQYFKAYNSGPLPDHVAIRGRHFDNQFQVPLLFFVTCLTYMVLQNVSLMSAVLAWLFIATRVAHSFVHLGGNYIPWRMVSYLLGFVIIWAMWVHILISAV